MRIDLDECSVALSVRELLPESDVEDPFAPGGGRLERLRVGGEIHRSFQAERQAAEPSYRAEVFVRGRLRVDEFEVRVEGRADGVAREAAGLVVEEVKSVLGAAEGLATTEALAHPAWTFQLRLYMWLLQPGEALPVRGRLVLVDVASGSRRTLPVEARAGEVEVLVVARVRELVRLARERAAWLSGWRQLAPALAFPFQSYRSGQRLFEDRAERALRSGGQLLAAAPPGLGKTAAALSAALRVALAGDQQVFFATSRTTQQGNVAATFQRIDRAAGGGLSCVVLRAREKACLNDVVQCHPDRCEFAQDYAARAHGSGAIAALSQGLAEPERVRALALEVRSCPFEMSLDLVAGADLVIGDANYVFDPRVALRRQFGGREGGWLLVVDEAHGLVERARAIFSPRLEGATLDAVEAQLDGRYDAAARELTGWLWDARALLDRAATDAEEVVEAGGGPRKWLVPAYLRPIKDLAERLEPLVFRELAERAASVAPEDPILGLLTGFKHLHRTLEEDGAPLATLWEEGPGGGSYAALCLDPAAFLRRRFAAFDGVLAMSATLRPLENYRDALGLDPERADLLELGSPFPPERRRVLVVPRIATTWAERGRYYGEAAAVVREVVAARCGSYVVFVPSFAYLGELHSRLELGDTEILEQTPSMEEAARGELLASLDRRDGRSRLLLAVQGGIFAEGVDYPGEMLIGVIVISPALPPVSPERELIKRHFDETSAAGFELAYVMPGMARVVQSAGRLIRSETDAGIIVLLDQRFRQHTYARHFPEDWALSGASGIVGKNLPAELRRFWDSLEPSRAAPAPR